MWCANPGAGPGEGAGAAGAGAAAQEARRGAVCRSVPGGRAAAAAFAPDRPDPQRRQRLRQGAEAAGRGRAAGILARTGEACRRSEEHTSELQSLMRISYAVFCLKKTPKKPRLTY